MGITGKIRLRKAVLYENCTELMIWDYIQIIEKDNLKYLVKSGPLPKKKILEKKIQQINQELAELRNQDSMIRKYDLISYRQELIMQVQFGATLADMLQTQVALNIIATKTFKDLILELESWGFYMNTEIPLSDALLEVKSEIEALQMTIEDLSSEIHPASEEEAQEQTEKSIFSFLSLLLIYERILNKNKIDPKTTSLMEFAVMEKEVNRITEENRKKSNTVQ